METQPDNLPVKTPAPSRQTRLNWWLGIYFCGVLVCLVDLFQSADGGDNNGFLGPAIFTVFLLPNGLSGMTGLSSALFTIPINWGIYIVHLIWTLRAETRQGFIALLIVLVILVSFSVVGCHEQGNYQPRM